MLSPGVRQVTHALLTRPPLGLHKIWPKSHQRIIPVRLACVKHAASVHPEPGSNSLKKYWSGFKTSTWLGADPSGTSSRRMLRILLILYPKILFVSLYRPILFWKFSLGIFSGLHYCLFVKVREVNSFGINSRRMLRILPCCASTLPTQRTYINTTVLRRQPFFLILQNFFLL